MGDWYFWQLGGWCALLALGIIGAALFRDRAKGRLRCPRCWYDMSGIASAAACPECGRAIRSPRALTRTRRHWRWACVGVLVGVGATVLLLTPKFRRDGVWSMAPTTVVILTLPYFDDDRPWQEMQTRIDDMWSEEAPIADAMADWQWAMFRRRCVDAIANGPAARRDLAADLIVDAPHHRLGPMIGFGPILAKLIDDAPYVGVGAASRLFDREGALADDEVPEVVAALMDLATTPSVQGRWKKAADPPARAAAIYRIRKTGHERVAAMTPPLVSLVDATPEMVRSAAILTLLVIPEPSDDTMRAILRRRDDNDPGVRADVYHAIDTWLARSSDRPDETLLPIRPIKASITVPGDVHQILLDGLNDRVQRPRRAAVVACRNVQDPTPEMIERLIELIGDDSVNRSVFRTLEALGPSAVDALPRLFDYATVRGSWYSSSLEAIGAIGAGREDVREFLLEALDEDNSSVAGSAAIGLAHFPEMTDRSVARLVELLDEDGGDLIALWALEEYGVAAKAAVPKVRAIATGEVSIWAIRTWWRIGGAVDEILPYVIDVLRRPRFEDEAPYLLSVLVEMGSAASSALPVLREVLDREPERGLREALRLTIEAIEE